MDNKNFLGTWKLLSFKLIYEDQTFVYPYGKKPIGYLTYTDINYMSVHIMRNDRINYISNDLRNITDKEKEEMINNYNGYCGKYIVKTHNRMIFHYPEINSFPNGCRVILKRYYEFKKNKLILTGITSKDKHYPYLVWKRVSSISTHQ